MPNLSHRLYRPHEDAPTVLDFIARRTAEPNFQGDFGLGDFVWSGFRGLIPGYDETLGIWEHDGTVVGLCWLQTPDECAFSLSSAVRASHLHDAIIAEMSAWALPRLRHLEPDSSAPLIVTVLEDDNRSATILTELGFTPTGIARHHSYTRQMTDPEPEPSLPAGFTVQAMTEDANLEDRVRIVTDVWPESSLTLARYHQIRSAPVYQPDLDLCITAPDGRYAAFLIAWLDPERGTVQFEPIGARPEFRRMGLTRALIQSALHRSQSLGATRALINCSADGEPENALYRSAGFTATGIWNIWHCPAGNV